MTKLTINAAEIHTAEQLHRLLSEELGFPRYYGMNLDALYDCLTDAKAEITVLHPEKFAENLGEQKAESFLRVLYDSAEANPLLTLNIE